jgi:DNA processing protein
VDPGTAAAFEPPAVAIVGSRAGRRTRLPWPSGWRRICGARGVVVVSGLARGVDSAAHRGALTGGATIAVLGSGPTSSIPKSTTRLRARLRDRAGPERAGAGHAAAAAVLSAAQPHHQRAVARGVVVEAGEKSGSLITARSALDQGRDVLAVPGAF